MDRYCIGQTTTILHIWWLWSQLRLESTRIWTANDGLRASHNRYGMRLMVEASSSSLLWHALFGCGDGASQQLLLFLNLLLASLKPMGFQTLNKLYLDCLRTKWPQLQRLEIVQFLTSGFLALINHDGPGDSQWKRLTNFLGFYIFSKYTSIYYEIC